MTAAAMVPWPCIYLSDLSVECGSHGVVQLNAPEGCDGRQQDG